MLLFLNILIFKLINLFILLLVKDNITYTPTV